MFWLAAQIFLLCLVSFLAGAGVTVLALRPRLRQDPAPLPASEPEPELEAEPEEEEEPVLIKASKKSMRYHTPDSPYYDRVSSSLTFISTQEAELAGYKPWNADKVKTPTA